jgi:hypothetical protein
MTDSSVLHSLSWSEMRVENEKAGAKALPSNLVMEGDGAVREGLSDG